MICLRYCILSVDLGVVFISFREKLVLITFERLDGKHFINLLNNLSAGLVLPSLSCFILI